MSDLGWGAGPFHNFWSWIQKWIQKFSNPGGPFHNFSSWTQKWKIYIDIFYGVSYNIKYITAISNLHLIKQDWSTNCSAEVNLWQFLLLSLLL